MSMFIYLILPCSNHFSASGGDGCRGRTKSSSHSRTYPCSEVVSVLPTQVRRILSKTCSADNAHIALLCARANTVISFCVYTVVAKVAEYMNQKCYSFRCLCVRARYQPRAGDTTLPYAACIVYPPCLYLYDRRCD